MVGMRSRASGQSVRLTKRTRPDARERIPTTPSPNILLGKLCLSRVGSHD